MRRKDLGEQNRVYPWKAKNWFGWKDIDKCFGWAGKVLKDTEGQRNLTLVRNRVKKHVTNPFLSDRWNDSGGQRERGTTAELWRRSATTRTR